MSRHTLFPIGLWCSHHYTWLKLGDAIVHRKLSHTECEGCQLEAELAESLLAEAKQATAQVEASWQA